MKNLLTLPLLLILVACKPDPYPENPDYTIRKPKVKYAPDRKNLEKMIKQLQGSPYVWAEEGPDKFDCSGFTYYLYGSMGIEIPRVAREQAKVGKKVSPKALKYGDLIFFATDRRHPRKITHVGVYLGDGWFTHASTVKHEVIYSNLFTSPYYKKRLRVCRRYLPEERNILNPNEPVWKQVPAKAADRTVTQPADKGKAIVIQTPIEQLQGDTTQGHYYVQAGSFSGAPKKMLLEKISRMGLKYRLIKFPKEGKTINKLLIGPYADRKSALEIRKHVRDKINPNAFIAEIR